LLTEFINAQTKVKTQSASWWRYERKGDELAPRSIFIRRMLASLGIALGVILISLAVGIACYHFLAGLNFVDSSAGGFNDPWRHGPVNELHSDGAKIFASIYALYSGLVVLALMGIVLTPVVHRVMHKFHVDEKDM
jgi:hypothetical protein